MFVFSLLLQRTELLLENIVKKMNDQNSFHFTAKIATSEKCLKDPLIFVKPEELRHLTVYFKLIHYQRTFCSYIL